MKEPYHWFGPATTIELRDQLNAAGPAPRLEVHRDGDGLMLQVLAAGELGTATLGPDAAGRQFQALNDSHFCPPDCA